MTAVSSYHLDSIADLPPITLAEVDGVASLQRRFDHKFLVAVARVPDLLACLGDSVRVLEVAGRRTTAYTSTYFDTPDLRTYRDHLQGRRRRFKVRTRHYGDPTRAMLEVKCKGHRRQTIKHRWPHPGPVIDVLDARARALVAEALDEQYGLAAIPELHPIATTRFRRITLADVAAAERVTIDLELRIEANGRAAELGHTHAVVETKSPLRLGAAARTIKAMGLRPQRVSKYCIGVVAAHDDLRGNPWLPALRRLTAGDDAASTRPTGVDTPRVAVSASPSA